MILFYVCHRKQGEKIGCDRFIGTPNFGVQGGRDATLFFFYGGNSLYGQGRQHLLVAGEECLNQIQNCYGYAHHVW